ncbi:MAG: cell wall hydrolase, partial [Oscillospiraceae bacterium]
MKYGKIIAPALLLIALAALTGAAYSRQEVTRPHTNEMLATYQQEQPKFVQPLGLLDDYAEPARQPIYTEADVTMLAKLIWAEARGVETTAEKAAVVWCVLNRVDGSEWEDTIAEVVTQRNQFAYYESSPETEELTALARDVLDRWQREKEGDPAAGRTLPASYTFFTGDGERNHFREEYLDTGD